MLGMPISDGSILWHLTRLSARGDISIPILQRLFWLFSFFSLSNASFRFVGCLLPGKALGLHWDFTRVHNIRWRLLAMVTMALLWLLQLLLSARRTGHRGSLFSTREQAGNADGSGSLFGWCNFLLLGPDRALQLRQVDIRGRLLEVGLMLFEQLFFFLFCKDLLEELVLVERVAGARLTRNSMLSVGSEDQILLVWLTRIERLGGNRLRRKFLFRLLLLSVWIISNYDAVFAHFVLVHGWLLLHVGLALNGVSTRLSIHNTSRCVVFLAWCWLGGCRQRFLWTLNLAHIISVRDEAKSTLGAHRLCLTLYLSLLRNRNKVAGRFLLVHGALLNNPLFASHIDSGATVALFLYLNIFLGVVVLTAASPLRLSLPFGSKRLLVRWIRPTVIYLFMPIYRSGRGC